MKNKLLLSCLSFVLLGFSGCEYIEDLNPAQGNRDYTTFTVRVENVSQPQTLSVERLDGIVPLSPGAFAVYPGNLYLGTNPMFLPGTPADGGTELIAEDGFPMQEAQLLKDYPAVRMSGTFDSPGGPGNTPALLPGETATFTIKARPGDRLQLETMFVQSNDWYYGFGKDGLDLFNGSNPVSGDMTQKLVLYDAGTEEDTPPATGPYQKPVQPPMATDIGPEDPYELIAPARERHPDYMIPSNSSVIKVTVMPQ